MLIGVLEGRETLTNRCFGERGKCSVLTKRTSDRSCYSHFGERMHRNIRGFHNEFSVPRFWSTGTAVDKSKHQHVCCHVPCLGRTSTHTHPFRAAQRRAPRPTLPRHLAPHALSICASAAPRPPVCPFASASHPYLRRPSPLPPRRCMLRSISRKKSLSFNHRHLNCFIYVLSYVAKLEDPQRGA